MQAKSLEFQNKPELQKQIDEANAFLVQADKPKYSLAQTKQINQSLGITYSSSANPSSGVSLEYGLAVNDSEMQKPFTFSIRYSTGTATLSEQFQVDASCQMMSTAVEYETNALTADGYSNQDTTYYVSGETKNNSKSYSVPTGKKFSLVLDQGSESDDPFTVLDRLDPQVYYPGGKLGLIRFKIEAAPAQTISAFGQTRAFQSRQFKYLSETDQVLFTYLVLEQPELNWIVTEDEHAQSLNWTLSYDVWKAQSLGTSATAGFSAQLPAHYLESNSSVKFLGPAPTYPHFDAYWSSSAATQDPQTGLRSVTLTENVMADYFEDAQPADLVSNDTIQTDLPEIQSIAQGIRTLAPDGDTYKQVSAILQWLNHNYQYDYEMLNDGIVHSLTTAEALKNHKGVCQHYAVVFTAIARALKIPARIVVGYLLSNDGSPAGFHAWVEAQVYPRLWSVIEPQYSYISEIQTRHYFPVARATFLEDQNADLENYFTATQAVSTDVVLPVGGK